MWLESRSIFIRNSMLIWGLLALINFFLGAFTDVDIKLADFFYDFEEKRFPWRSEWFAELFLHSWVKGVIVTYGVALIVVSIIDSRKPILCFYDSLRLRIVAISAIVIPSTIAILKRFSSSHCPWDIDRYGGNSPYIKIFDTLPAGFSAGHCMPAGHASTGLWLAAFAVFWLPHNPIRALFVGIAGLGIGIVLGWFQQMRGAHFLTHTLWSVWIAGVIVTLLIALFWRLLHIHHQPISNLSWAKL